MKVTSQQYLDANPDVKAAGVDPLQHVLTHVLTQPLSLHEARKLDYPDDFDGAAYVAYHKDVARFYTAETALNHYLNYGWREPGRWPLPVTPPPGGDEILDFNRVAECDNQESIYFSVGKVNGVMHFGEYGYQSGRKVSKLFAFPHSLVQSFNAESVFDIKKFKNNYYLTVEHGKWDTVDKAMIFQLQGTVWNEVYRHPEWDLMFHLHVHGDYLYATGAKLNGQGGTIRSSDGVSWSPFIGSSDYWQWDMTTLGNDIWFSGAYGGDYGGNCHHAVWKNQSRVWDGATTGAGFLGIAAFVGDIFLGQANPAQIMRFSDKRIVLNLPGQEKVTKLIVDESANTLYAITCEGDSATSGAEVWSTKDGTNWKQMPGPYSVPHLFNAYYDPDTKEMWLVGGKFSQGSGGYGGVYRSVR